MALPLRVGILGAGRIAQGFDAPGDASVLTLAHAFRRADQFQIGGFYDLDPAKAEQAERKWHCPASPRQRQQWLDQAWDVVCIATPDAQHAEDLKDVLERSPRAVLVEKPVTSRAEQAEALLALALERRIPVLVDYPRRWHSATAAIQQAIREDLLGAPRFASFVVSGGMIHNGVHLLDLFHGWWGGGWTVSCRDRHGSVARLTLRGLQGDLEATFTEVPADCYHVLELHVYGTRAKLTLAESPEILELAVPRPHPRYPTFRVLRSAQRGAMDEEPLLPRMAEALARLARDPAAGLVQTRREADVVAFMAKVLPFFSQTG